MQNVIRRELRVAFSKKAQPPLFRVIKWIVFIAITALIRRTRFFWPWVVGLPLLGVAIHFSLSLEDAWLDSAMGRLERP